MHGHYFCQLLELLGDNKEDRDGHILLWNTGVKFIGGNGKVSLSLERHLPIASTVHSIMGAMVFNQPLH